MVGTNFFELDIGGGNGNGGGGSASRGGRGGGRGGRGGAVSRPSGNGDDLTYYHYDVMIDPVRPDVDPTKELTPEEKKARNEKQ